MKHLVLAGQWLSPETLEWLGGFLKDYGRPLFTVLLLVFVVLFRLLLVRAADRRIHDGARYRKVRKLLNYLTVLVVLVGLWRIWVGRFGSLGTFLGLLSAGVAIAMQDTIANVTGAMYIFWSRAFHVGDRIEVGDTVGDVIDTGLFQTTLLEVGRWVDADQSTGRIVTIPNSVMLKKPIYNYTKGFTFIWHEVPVVVTFESNWKLAKQIVLEVGKEVVGDIPDQAAAQIRRLARRFNIKYGTFTPTVYTRVVDNGVLLTLRCLTRPRQRRAAEQAIWEKILERFARRPDIDFAYPTTRYYDNRAEGKPGTGGPQTMGRPSHEAYRAKGRPGGRGRQEDGHAPGRRPGRNPGGDHGGAG